MEKAQVYNAAWEQRLNTRMDALQLSEARRAEISLSALQSSEFRTAASKSQTDVLPNVIKAAAAQWSVIDAAIDAEEAELSKVTH